MPSPPRSSRIPKPTIVPTRKNDKVRKLRILNKSSPGLSRSLPLEKNKNRSSRGRAIEFKRVSRKNTTHKTSKNTVSESSIQKSNRSRNRARCKVVAIYNGNNKTTYVRRGHKH